MVDYSKYRGIGFDDFRRLAADPELSTYEKIGFPDSYREGKEDAIFSDIKAKLSNLQKPEKIVLDIGAGCSELPKLLIDHCIDSQQKLYLIDSREMLSLLPDKKGVEKIAGYYPEDMQQLCNSLTAKVDVILVYSVIQYVFTESNVWDFLDQSLGLLAEGGQMLIGDIPNISKRKRFFSSNNGKEFHKQFMATENEPEVIYNQIEKGQVDDTVVQAIVQRARIQGFDAYILPQADGLPMANRREDILITRP